MLIGHYAPALLAHRARPTLRLWQLFVAAQLVDIAWGLCVLLGIEHVRIVPGFTASNDLELWDMPYTHGLVATAGWVAATFVLARALRRGPTRTADAAILALVVASHFATDLIVHAGDLPVLGTAGPKLGFGLWRDRTLAVLVETALFAGAAWAWWRPRDGVGGGRGAGLALLVMTAVAAASYYVPTPPSADAMALAGLATYVACAVVAWRIESRR